MYFRERKSAVYNLGEAPGGLSDDCSRNILHVAFLLRQHVANYEQTYLFGLAWPSNNIVLARGTGIQTRSETNLTHIGSVPRCCTRLHALQPALQHASCVGGLSPVRV